VLTFQITISTKHWDDFTLVFGPLIEGLVFEMRAGSIVDSSYKPALLALTELAEIRDSGASTNRPICKLLTEMVLPTPRPRVAVGRPGVQ
jgi:hypothetical protein